MPELRYDLHLGEWTLIAPERRARPHPAHHARATPRKEDPVCPFCPGRENETSAEIAAIRKGGGWHARCVANKYPAVGEGERARGGSDVFSSIKGGGRHEVLIDSARHTKGLADLSDTHAGRVLGLLQHRTRALVKHSGVRCVFAFKNHGAMAGASILHSHMQILALPAHAGNAERKRRNEAAFHKECKAALLDYTLAAEREKKERMVEPGEEGAAVFCPWGSRFPYLACITPWPTEASFLSSAPRTIASVGGALARTLRRYKARLNDPPVNVFLFLATEERDENSGAHRWHIELFPRLTPLAGLEAGLGVHVNEVTPEHAADALRRADFREPPAAPPRFHKGR